MLGLAPEVAAGWDADERAAARDVIERGLHEGGGVELPPATTDAQLATSLATADDRRARAHEGALGVVRIGSAKATAQPTTLAPTTAARSFAIEQPREAPIDGRALEVVAHLAADAGHTDGPLVVTRVSQLAVPAAYVPRTPTSSARLLVNPIVLAVIDPQAPLPALPTASSGASAGPTHTPAIAGTTVIADQGVSPYNFYTSIPECAAAEKLRCEKCVVDGSCTSLTKTGDGTAECNQLLADTSDRNFSLACVNLALAIDTVSTCAASDTPDCPRDTSAGASLDNLEANADFVDTPACAAGLDICLNEVFNPDPSSGSSGGDPNFDSSSAGTSCADVIDGCDASGCDSSSCDSSGDGSSGCDSSSSSGDSGCDSSSGSSGCDDSGESSCDSSSTGGCDSGGDSSCNVAARSGAHTVTSHAPLAILWALLPLPFARRLKRRSERAKARAASEEVPS